MNIVLLESVNMGNHTRNTEYSTIHFHEVFIDGEDEGENLSPKMDVEKSINSLDPPVTQTKVNWTMCTEIIVNNMELIAPELIISWGLL